MPERPQQSTTSVETMVARAQVGAPLLLRIFSGLGSFASTVMLGLIAFAWNEVRTEWSELKASVEAIQIELAQQPSPEEFEKLRDRVEQINERLIRIESRFEE